MNLKKIGKVFTSKFVGTGPSSYKKRIYRASVSQRWRNTALDSKSSKKNIYTMYYVKNRLNIGVTVAADFNISVLSHVVSHHNTHCYRATCCLHGCDDLQF